MVENRIIKLIQANQWKGWETLDEIIWDYATNEAEAEEIENIIDWDTIHTVGGD